MRVRSLGYRTDLIFAAFDGIVTDRGDHLVIRTPTNPTFFWGNFILFDRPPGAGDFERWREVFAREIGAPPEVKHQVFGWDATRPDPGLVRPFLSDGFRLESAAVLTADRRTLKPGSQAEVTVRPLVSDDDYTQSVENQVACREPEFTEQEHRVFRRRQMDRYRSMRAAGRGSWFGAFAGKRLVADLGIFHDGAGGRFQAVQTHPDFRRRGVAARLIAESAAFALDEFDLDTLVIVSEAGSAAQRLYESLGFRVTEHQHGLTKWPGRSPTESET
jgi:GNAT superfamily N-acetyltransferase